MCMYRVPVYICVCSLKIQGVCEGDVLNRRRGCRHERAEGCRCAGPNNVISIRW